MKTTIENLIRNRMKAYVTHSIGNVEITYNPRISNSNHYTVFAPALGVETFKRKQKMLDYLMNDLQL